ncbi:MAG: DUF1294 domain-containing protein [Clostridia bacterium]|nr:DUF1294 domain-containing protein [Clostridia bacterium]
MSKELLLGILGVLLLLNLVTYIVYASDKRRARKNRRRVPEKTLLLLAACGGSVGALIAMYTLRHKTLHKKFTFGVPAILIAQIALVIFIFYRVELGFFS